MFDHKKMKKSCKSAKTYKGIRYPQCDRGDGRPCDTCMRKWVNKVLAQKEENQ